MKDIKLGLQEGLILGYLRDIQRLAKEAEDYVERHPHTISVAAFNIAGAATKLAFLAGRAQESTE